MRLDRTLLAGLTLGSVATLAAQPPAQDDSLLEDIRERVAELQQGQNELREQVAQLTTHLLGEAATSAPLVADEAAEAPRERRAMTWILQRELGSNLVSLGADEVTDAYDGDTSVNETLPLLAFRPGNLDLPQEMLDANTTDHWSGGSVMLTSPVLGTEITSLERANEIIREELGEGWQMADFHLGGGWRFWARGHVPADQRFWVHIRDQDANPWESEEPAFQSFEDLLIFGDC
ncbi:MAG: hypothetical protein ACYS26_04195 [Planctomycetota bacterium]|jgi:hypothetical protein